jgi:hypothetical protein
MAIQATCPNPTCRQSLQVPDQYAGAQGKCPKCGTLVLFPHPAAAAVPAAPPAAPPPLAPSGNSPAYTAAPPAPAPYDPAALPGPAPPVPAGPPRSTAELVQMICLPAGLFFLFMLIICSFLPWAGSPLVSFSGVRLGDAGIFLVLCLLVGAAAGLTYLFKWLLPSVAAVAAGFGILAFFIMLGGLIAYGGEARVGVWLGLFMAIGAAGAFITLAVFRPVESPALQELKLPLMKPHGGLILAAAAGVVIGFFYLILTAISKAAQTPMTPPTP